MEQKTDTTGKKFNLNMIKSSLNSSMEQDNITVSEELVKNTIERIQSQKNLNSSKTSNNQRWKKKLNLTNVAAAVLIVFLMGTLAGKNILEKNYSGDIAKRDNGISYEMDVTNDGQLNTDDADLFALPQDNNRVLKEEALEENAGNDIDLASIMNLEASDIENLEVYYYLDNTVINKDLTAKIEDVFALFNTYPLEETNAGPVEEWIYKFNVIPSGKSIYTILIGDNIDIIKETKITDSSNSDKFNDQDRKTFRVIDIVGLKIQLDQLINVN